MRDEAEGELKRDPWKCIHLSYGQHGRHPLISAYNLYEAANFTRWSTTGQFEGAWVASSGRP